MKTSEIRKAFLDYFAENDHAVIESSALIPDNDPSLLFTNAGMVQFKDVFLGNDPRPYKRATSSQRCVRAGGKHNDLENVGYTARHHTFFEMLGNFSFGDYFKREAIAFGWNFLTKTLGLPEDKLWVTVFQDDDEAADIWLKEMKIDPNRFSRLGEKDNFWSMGDTGPCGPCTEIFYDHGEAVAGGPPGSPDEDGDRYIEIWNLVFMQFNRDKEGNMTPLPKPSVDTGMGLERIAAVMQGVHSNYEIDLFEHIITAISDLLGVDRTLSSVRVIADHIRSTSFLILDGVLPSNEGRGYVLRRIIRRAIRHGYKLGADDIFFYKIVRALVEQMGEAYPALADAQSHIENVLKAEEEQFARTLEQGMRIFEEVVAGLENAEIPGEAIFKLYDTYGFPVDLTADIARERELTLDHSGFEACMQEQRERSQKAGGFSAKDEAIVIRGEFEFTGYNNNSHSAVVTDIYVGGKQVEALVAGEEAVVILDQSPFYAESGGQVGDAGYLHFDDGVFEVTDTQKYGDVHGHIGRLRLGALQKNESVRADIDLERRQKIALNHSATHLLHAALREVLGKHVAQKGSLVDPDKLRFDFSHTQAVTAKELKAIEELVNQKIIENLSVAAKVMSMDEAKDAGAMALFGEKYGSEVRVLTMGEFSMELCGGTHVTQTGDIGCFTIVSESGIAAGVRRIEAITGMKAFQWLSAHRQQLQGIASLVKADVASVSDKVKAILDQNKALEKSVAQLQSKLSAASMGDLAGQAVKVGDIELVVSKLDGVDAKALRDLVDQVKQKLSNGVVVLAIAGDNKVSLAVGVTKALSNQIKAGELVNYVAQQVGGKGGGRPDMAMAGGSDVDSLPGALDSVQSWIEGRL
tara:strand:+ start:644 stop:3232 length:2589 start_codon:yes stop_codon:yes gene_type:complete